MTENTPADGLHAVVFGRRRAQAPERPHRRRRRARRGRGPNVFARKAAAGVLVAIPAVVSAMSTAPPAAANPSSRHAVKRYVHKVVRSGVPGIAVAVTKDGKVMQTAAAGTNGHGGPLTTRTRMRTESLSKSFTSLAVMQLVDKGAIDLDEPVTQYLPHFSLDDPHADQITVRQLLAQTSGIADKGVPELYDTSTTTLKESVAELRAAHLVSDPGTEFHYSNPNYHVAARVVEKVSGESFDAYLDAHVLDPLGMRSTMDTYTAAQPVPGIATGHTMVYGKPVPSHGFDYFTEGSGGIVSTTEDMARWLVMQQSRGRTPSGEQLVSPRSVAATHHPQRNADGYGLGWYHAESAEGPPVRTSHTGAGASFGAYQGLFPDSGYGVVVLVNYGAALTAPDPGVLGQNLLAHIDPDIPPLSDSSLPTPQTDLILTGLVILTMVLGVLGVAHARRWARRRARRSRIITALRLVPLLAVIAVVLSVPALQLATTGRVAPYELLFYTMPVAVIWLLLAGLAAALVFTLRTLHYLRIIFTKTTTDNH